MAQEEKDVLRQIFDSLDSKKQQALTIDDFVKFFRLFGVDKYVDTKTIAQQDFILASRGAQSVNYQMFEAYGLPMLQDLQMKYNMDLNIQNLFCPAFTVIQKLQHIQTLLPSENWGEVQQIIDQIADGNIYEPNTQMLRAFTTKFLTNEARLVLDEYSELRRMSQRSQDEENTRSMLQQRMKSSPTDNSPVLFKSNLDIDILNPNFDIFALFESNQSNMIQTLDDIGIKLFLTYNFNVGLGIDIKTYKRFLDRIGEGYLQNPYHNALHAADVMQTTNMFIQIGQFIEHLNVLEIFSLLISAVIHDFEHPGLNNGFLEKTRHNLAIKYNDISILENHHIAASFKIMQQDKYNILKSVTPEEFRQIRRLIITCVLGTDMSKHQSHIADLNKHFILQDREQINKTLILSTVLHGADISNPLKPFQVSYQWAHRVTQEFFLQGDKEKEIGLDVTPLFDRDTVTLPQSQIGFIKGVVLPYFTLIVRAFPEMQPFVDNGNNNCEEWASRLGN